MAQVTEPDEIVALAATMLLSTWGRGDLSVSGSQVVYWRQAGLFEIPSGHRTGRGNTRRYPDNAAEIAAKFRLILESNKNIDEALLAAFADGLDVGTSGIQTAFRHTRYKLLPKIKKARLPNKRSERLTFPGPRSAVKDLDESIVIDLMLDSEPMYPPWVDRLMDRFGGREVIEYFRHFDGLERLRDELRLVSFAGLMRTVREAPREDLQWAMGVGNTFVEYAMAVSELYGLTGSMDADLGNRAIAALGSALEKAVVATGVQKAFLAPALLLFSSDPSTRDRLNEAAEQCRQELPIVTATANLAAELRESWRPCLGPGGLAKFASLADDEAFELLTSVRSWLDRHPEEAAHVVLVSDESLKERIAAIGAC
jgi:hypothetical protein